MNDKKGRGSRKYMRVISMIMTIIMLISSANMGIFAEELRNDNLDIVEAVDNVDEANSFEVITTEENSTEAMSATEASTIEVTEEADATVTIDDVVTEETEASEEELTLEATRKTKLYVTPKIHSDIISGYPFEYLEFEFENRGTETIEGIKVKSFECNKGTTLDGVEDIPHIRFAVSYWPNPFDLYRENTMSVTLEPGEKLSGKIYTRSFAAGTKLNATITFAGDNFDDCTTQIELNYYNPDRPEAVFAEYKYNGIYYEYDHPISRIDLGTVPIGTSEFTTLEAPYRRKFGIKNISSIIDEYTDDYPVLDFQYEIIGEDADVFEIYTGGPWSTSGLLKKDEWFEFAIKAKVGGLMPGTYSASLHFYNMLPLNTNCSGKVLNGDLYIPITIKVEGGSDYYYVAQAVTGLKAEAGDGYNYISWDAVGGSDQRYYVEYKPEGFDYYRMLSPDEGILGDNYIYDFDIENGVKVQYRACAACDDDSESENAVWAWSDPVEATPTSGATKRIMPVYFVHNWIDPDYYKEDGKKYAKIEWTLYDHFDNGDGEDRYIEDPGKSYYWTKNSSLDYFYILLDGKKVTDKDGNLIKIYQDSYKVGSEWHFFEEYDCAQYVDTFSWSYDIPIEDDYAHYINVVPVAKDGTEGIISIYQQLDYNYFDNDKREPIPYPEKPVDEKRRIVRFDGNGGFSRAASKEVINGESYGALTTAVRSGYRFVGWFTAKTGGTQVLPEYIVNISTEQTLYAHWTSISHKVTLNANGGKTDKKTITVIDGETYYELPDPTYNDHEFVGWFTEQNGGTEITRETIVDLNGDITLYAHWLATYCILLYPEPGTMDAVPAKIVTVGKPYGELPVPTYDGYVFMGWYLEKAGGEAIKITADTIVTEPKSHDLVAYWGGATYTISFDGNGLDITEEDREVNFGIPYGELPTLTRTGYTFDGWFTDPVNGEQVTASTKVKIADNHTLYAHWSKTPYRIIFNTMADTVPVPDKTVYYDNEPFGELPQAVLAGGIFKGWFTEAFGGVEITAESKLQSEADLNVYAHWEYKYTAEAPFADIEEGEVKAGTRINLFSETVDARIYYTTDPAIGMAVDENSGMLWEESYEINDDVTIYAIATKTGVNNSIAKAFTYTIMDESSDWGEVAVGDRIGITSPDNIPKEIWVAGVEDRVYNGKPVNFDKLNVYWNKKRLSEGTDYSIRYNKNTNAGKAEVAITGKGEYTGKLSVFFNIAPRSLGDGENNSEKLKLPDVSVSYTGRTQKKTTYVAYNLAADDEDSNFVELKAGRDFKYVYATDDEYKGKGPHRIEIVGMGNYVGTAFFSELIEEDLSMLSKLKIAPIPQQKAPRLGDEVKPDIVVMDGRDPVNDEYYSVEYMNNTKPGTATVIVTGDGIHYSGSKTATFKIAALSIRTATVSELESKIYTGGKITQTGYELSYKENRNADPETLVEGKDYIVSYTGNVNAGKKATIVFEGIGRFSGKLTKNFEIKPYNISDSEVVLPTDMGTYPYQKNGTMPEINITVNDSQLKAGTDYTVKYYNNKNVNDAAGNNKPYLVITGKGNYAGTVTRYYKIAVADISKAKLEVSDIVYANKSGICKPKLTVTDTNGIKLIPGTDYDKTRIEYTYVYDTYVVNNGVGVVKSGETSVDGKDIIPAGSAIRVTIHGIRNYEGSENSAIFRFVENDIAKAKVTIAAKTYTGRDILLSKDDINISYKNVPLEKSDYEIIGYNKNQKSGTAQVIIKGVGNYGGVKAVNFKINKKPLPYTISFDANNAYMSETKPYAAKATGTMRDVQLQTGSKLPVGGFKRNGYKFNGWNTKKDGSGASYTDKEAFELKENPFAILFFGHTVKLYAQWVPVEYMVTYVGAEDGVLNVTNSNPKMYNVESDIVFADPTREGYDFDGWYTDSTYKKKLTGIEQGTFGNKKVYAKWSKK